MKTCSRCGIEYVDYGQRNSFCRSCKRAYDREYHRRRSDTSKQRKLSLQTKRLKELLLEIQKYKTDRGCEICGEKRSPCLHFDHKDMSDKHMEVSEMVKRGYSRDKIFAEIDKCRILCANCHAIRTAEQLGWYNYHILTEK